MRPYSCLGKFCDRTRFDQAFVNATVYGPSRMCYYTGRHMSSHGSTWNSYPLRVGEPTLGDHMRALGYRVVLVGKTHMYADEEGMKRLGVSADSIEGVLAQEAGFEPYERDDGLHPDKIADPDLAYNKYLRDQGYEGVNPWHSSANSSVDEQGESFSGWLLRNANKPADVAAEHSETAYMTDRAIEFMQEWQDKPWLLRLSYIKPHWPYIVSAPYHDMFSARDVKAPVRNEAERAQPHPIYEQYMNQPESQAFSDDHVGANLVSAYMGLIRQMDDHIGRLLAFMKDLGLDKNTIIVMSSDHGDYLGDH